MCPRRGTFFSCLAKKRRQKKATPSLRPLRGKPASVRLRGAPWNSLRCCAAPFRQPRRVSSRSMRAPTRMPPRNRPAAGAATGGLKSTRANAALGLACAAHSACACACASRGRAQRWPVWLLGAQVPFWPCREAQRRGCACVPKDTHASSSIDPAGIIHEAA